ncbi:MAG: hypothetical protein WAV56_01250, partial [Microgenomates group bacterium]
MKPFDVNRLASVKGMNYDLAFSLVRVYPTAADLLGLDVLDLLLTIEGMSLEAADGALVYAHVLRKQDVPPVVAANSVSIDSLQALYDTAIETWLRKGMITTGPLRVTFEGIDLWVKAVSRCFYIDACDFGSTAGGYRVWGPTSLVNALSTMGRRQWQLPLDGVLRGLISF